MKTMLKKIFSLFVICSLLIPSFISVTYANESNSKAAFPIYTTTDGYSYSPSDIVIYWSDLANLNCQTQQQLIDQFYILHNTRIEPYDGVLEIVDKLTPSEIVLVIQGFLTYGMRVLNLKICLDQALYWTEQNYPIASDRADGTRGNAFQHAFWVLSMSCNFDCEFALGISTAHEDRPDNQEIHMNMDLQNNDVAYDYYVANMQGNSNYTYEQIANIAKSLVDSGQLCYIIWNYSYTSAIVVERFTMREISRTNSYGNFYAWTNSTIPYNVPEPEIRYFNGVPELNGLPDYGGEVD